MACDSYRSNLVKRRDQVAQKLADMDRDALAGSKPNVKTADGGTTVDHVGYRKSLYEELSMIDELINKFDMQGGDSGSDGLEVTSYAE